MSFLGNEVSLERYSTDVLTNQIEEAIAVVGQGIEFPDTDDLDLPGGIQIRNADINVGSADILFAIDTVTVFRFGNVDGFNGYVIRDINDTIDPIVNVSIVEEATNLDFGPERLSFNENGVFLDLNNLDFNSNQELLVTVEFADPDEPSEEDEEALQEFDDILLVARLYTATFGRDPDFEGLNFWNNQLDALGRTDLVREFLFSDEFEARFGAPGDLDSLEFVEVMYENVLGRPGEAAGIDFWAGLLEDGSISKEETLDFFVTAPENVDNTERFEDFIVLNVEPESATRPWEYLVEV